MNKRAYIQENKDWLVAKSKEEGFHYVFSKRPMLFLKRTYGLTWMPLWK